MASKRAAQQQSLNTVEALYEGGEVDAAFERLEQLLAEQPNDPKLLLFKAEWSTTQRRNAEFVGDITTAYRQSVVDGSREEAVIKRALEWSERCLSDARRHLNSRDVEDAFASLETCAQVAPWEARNFLAQGLLLVDALPTFEDNEDLSNFDVRPAGRSGAARIPQFMTTPAVTTRLQGKAAESLEKARALTQPHDFIWKQATRQLSTLAETAGDIERALTFLNELRDAGEDVQSLIITQESRIMQWVLHEAALRALQLIRQENLDAAADLIQAILASDPTNRSLWALLADWFILRKNDPAAASIYRWLMSESPRDASTTPASGNVAASTERLRTALASLNITCKRCGKDLAPAASRCAVCNAVLRTDQLLADRFDVSKLKVGQLAILGLIDLKLRHNEIIEASSLITTLIGQLERRNPVMPRLDAWQREIKPKAEAHAYDTALDAAISLARAGKLSEAHSALQALISRGDERLAAWLALTLTGVTSSVMPIVRRAARIETSVWGSTPSPLRQHLVNTLLAAGWLPEARQLLNGLFTEAERKTKKVQVLYTRCDKLIDVRCNELLTEARFAIEAGRIDDAFAPIAQVLGIDPKHSGALLLRGQLHLINDAPYSAAADFRTVMETAPPAEVGIGEAAAAAAVGLARTYEALSDLPEALATLDLLPSDLPEVRVLKSHFERQRQGRPAVRIKELAASEGSMYTGTFAISVRAVMRWREGDRLMLSRREIIHAGHEFVATLGGLAESAGNPTFELRLIATPDIDAPTRGTLRMALMCRIMSMIPEGAERLALELWDRLRSHLPVAEHYIYQYEPVYNDTELEWLLQPFDVRDAAEIVRREAWEGDAYAVQPFSTGGTTLENLAWILLRQGEPCMVTMHLEPTQLQANESTEFRKNLERLRRIRLPDDEDGSNDSFDRIPRTVFLPDGQRGTLAEMAGDLNSSLEKRAYLMHITVASAEPHASMLSHHIASEIFGPGGRYDVIHVAKERAMKAVRYNLGELDAIAWVQNNAPRGLARLRYLVSEIEAGWTFRMPLPGIEGIAGMEQIAVKAAPPTLLPAEGIMLGESVATISGVPAMIRTRQADRRRHAYVIGKTGVGKSTLLEAMALQDIEAGRGVAFLDPHGDSVESILGRIPAHRMEDVIVFDPSDEDRPIGLNFLEAETDSQRHRIATEFIQMLMRMYDPHQMGIVGPRFQHNVRNAMLTAMMAVEGATLIELVRVLTDSSYVKEILPRVSDPVVRNYWEKQIANTSDFHKSEVLDYIVSKFNRFVGDVRIRNIIGQSKSSLDFRAIMDDRKILLVNLSKGKIGPESAEFLGFLLLQSLLIAALSRADQVREERDDYCLYVDEFQTFATESFAAMLSEGRKYGICLVMANQYLGQLPGDLREAVFGNVGSLIAFGVGSDDAQRLAPQFYPVFGGDDLMNMPKFTAAVRLLVDGMQARPFAMRTRLVKRIPDASHAGRIRETSRMRYGRDINSVNAEISARFKLAA